MEKKQIIKIIGILLIIFIALIIFENILRGFSRVTENIKTSNQIKKEEREYQKTEKYALEQSIESSVKRTVDLIQSGDYETIYSKLDPVYKDFMQFESVDAFKEYMTNYIGTPLSARLIDYSPTKNKYYCTISISTETKSETYTVIVQPLDNDDFYIIPDNLTSIENVLGKYFASNSMAEFNLKYKASRKAYNTYVIDVRNLSDKTIEGSFQDSTLTMSDYKVYGILNDVSSIKIEPGETVQVRFDIDETKSSAYEENYLTINYKGNNGESFEIDLRLIDFENDLW